MPSITGVAAVYIAWAVSLSPARMAWPTFLMAVRNIERILALCRRRFSACLARFLACEELAKLQSPVSELVGEMFYYLFTEDRCQSDIVERAGATHG